MKKFTIVIAILCIPFFAMQLNARHVYVKLASDAIAWSSITSDGINNVVITLPVGSTNFVGNVLTSLQHGDTVWVAKGTYSIVSKLALNDDTNGNVYGGIPLYGGFFGTETSASQRAISDLDGNGLIEPWEFTNETHFVGTGTETSPASYQMFQLGGTTGGVTGSILDGVTVSDHYYGSVTAAGGLVGGGCKVRYCTFRNLKVFSSSTSTSNGGALYVTGGNVLGCLFESCANIAGGSCYGGALLIYGIADNTAGTPTGWIKNSMIRNCFAGNTSNGNTATGRGGAIFAKSGVTVENCVIYNNEVAGGNTGTNCSAVFFHAIGDANNHVNRIIGCTIALNAGTYAVSSDAKLTEIYNTILWGNSAVESPNADGTSYNNTLRFPTSTTYDAFPYANTYAIEGTVMNPTMNKSNISPILFGGAMNDLTSNPNPGFKKPTAYGYPGIAQAASDLDDIRTANWTLLTGSPLIDAGINAPTNTNIVTGTTPVSLNCVFSGIDVLGRSRASIGNSFDIGAYEYGAITGIISPNIINTSIRMSVNGNILSIFDLNEVSNVSVYSSNGVLISSKNGVTGSVNIPMFAKGVYIVNVRNNNQIKSQKIIL